MSDLAGFPTPILNARATVTWPRLNGGRLLVYTAPRPATNGGEITTQTLLAEFTLPDPVGEIENGVFTAASIDTTMILADGTPAWVRGIESGIEGAVICDLDAGVTGSGEAVELDNLSLVAGAFLSVTSFVVAEG